MAQSYCILDGYTFPYNPYPYVNAPVKSSTYLPTVGGGVVTTFLTPSGGTFVQDQQIEMTWAVIDTAFYNSLTTKFQTPRSLAFYDPSGVQYTVRFMHLTPQSPLRGGDNALENVKASLQVISQP